MRMPFCIVSLPVIPSALNPSPDLSDTGVPGISSPPVISLPARPPLGISPSPPPSLSQRHSSENILVFRPSYQESFWNMVWLLKYYLTMDLHESDSEPMLSDFSKSWSSLPSHHIRDYSFAAASMILLCLFNIANVIDCLVGDTSLRLIYIH